MISDGRNGEKKAGLAGSANVSICCRCLTRAAEGQEMENLWRRHGSLPPLQQPLLDSSRFPRTSWYKSYPLESRRFLHHRQV